MKKTTTKTYFFSKGKTWNRSKEKKFKIFRPIRKAPPLHVRGSDQAAQGKGGTFALVRQLCRKMALKSGGAFERGMIYAEVSPSVGLFRRKKMPRNVVPLTFLLSSLFSFKQRSQKVWKGPPDYVIIAFIVFTFLHSKTHSESNLTRLFTSSRLQPTFDSIFCHQMCFQMWLCMKKRKFLFFGNSKQKDVFEKVSCPSHKNIQKNFSHYFASFSDNNNKNYNYLVNITLTGGRPSI